MAPRYSPEQRTEALALLVGGMTTSQAGATLGINPGAIWHWAKKAEIELRYTWNRVSDKRAALEVKRAGSAAAAARRLGVSDTTVRNRVDRVGGTRKRNRRWTDSEIITLDALYFDYRDNGRLRELSKMLNHPYDSVVHKAETRCLTDRHAPRRWAHIWAGMSRAEKLVLFEEWKDSGATALEFCTQRGLSYKNFRETLSSAFPGQWSAAIEAAQRAQGTAYAVGVDLEGKIRRQLAHFGVEGYPSPGSRGSADIVAFAPNGESFMIQAKKKDYLRVDEWNTLIKVASTRKATPLLATNPTGRDIVFYRLLAEKKGGVNNLAQPREQVWFTAAGELTNVDPAALAA